MLDLINLPPEIILHVLDYLDGFDLENFTATCRHFLDFEKERLAEHRRLKCRYGNVSISLDSLMDELRTSGIFICLQLMNPGVCIYPRRLSHLCSSHWRGYNFRHYELMYMNSITDWSGSIEDFPAIGVFHALLKSYPLFGYSESQERRVQYLRYC